ncbi:putative oxalocrotonate tautomerase [Mycena maculata]|uniref:Oxalocrotonate tautomerase n=1 Tax=Mycena maculata TaxID=230809 RepID=A0AAD7NJD4_9AGAR|nr:putative oxalocrotonate tautomerase [Mycena maculata]
MPLHRLFVPKGLYSPEERDALAAAITDLYTSPPLSLPAFYVVVLFIELDAANIFVGRNIHEKMLRIAVERVTQNFTDNAQKRQFMDIYEKALAPFTTGCGLDWEIQVVDCDRLLWNINGMVSPEFKSAEERLWKRENRAVTREEIEALRAAGQL